MFPGPRAQICFALLAFLTPALCAAQNDTASAPREAPFIALLLPLNAQEFAPASEAVRLGCQAALTFAENRVPLQIVRTDAKPESIVFEYEATVQRGASVVVGPLTRSAVTALAASGRITTVTLALNTTDGDVALPPRLFTFGLSVEPEARQVARIAFARGLRDAVVVQASTFLARRVSRAFADEWFSLGGRIGDVREFSPQSNLVELRQHLGDVEAQMVFLSADADQARLVRPYLNNQMPVFATSQINDGKTGPLVNSDLNGIRFVDMPWIVQPDHAAVMVYPRLEGFSSELQRLYALGIDACRIASGLMAGQSRIDLDGVTGRISLRSGNAVQRDPVQAVFRDGAGVALEEQR